MIHGHANNTMCLKKASVIDSEVTVITRNYDLGGVDNEFAEMMLINFDKSANVHFHDDDDDDDDDDDGDDDDDDDDDGPFFASWAPLTPQRPRRSRWPLFNNARCPSSTLLGHIPQNSRGLEVKGAKSLGGGAPK